MSKTPHAQTKAILWHVGALHWPAHVCAWDLARGIKLAKWFCQVITFALVHVRQSLLVANYPSKKWGPLPQHFVGKNCSGLEVRSTGLKHLASVFYSLFYIWFTLTWLSWPFWLKRLVCLYDLERTYFLILIFLLRVWCLGFSNTC